MLHPDTKVETAPNGKGVGVFATKAIPLGTITFAQDDLDVVVPRDSVLLHSQLSPMIQKFGYREPNGNYVISWDNGNYVISWDNGKYMNHCCFPNTLNTGYGFEIAIRNIAVGEEVTDDYDLLNLECEMQVSCEKKYCRGTIGQAASEGRCEKWDRQIRTALRFLGAVKQPLFPLLSAEVRRDLLSLENDPASYVSVRTLFPPEKGFLYDHQTTRKFRQCAKK